MNKTPSNNEYEPLKPLSGPPTLEEKKMACEFPDCWYCNPRPLSIPRVGYGRFGNPEPNYPEPSKTQLPYGKKD